MQTEVTRLLGIEYPIIQGGMAWVAEYHLAAATSNAGGLGLIGAASAPAEWVREQIQEAKKLTDRPFGVNIMLMSPYADEVAKIVAEEGVKVVTTGAGNPEKYMKMWKEAGVKVIPVVASVALAKRMERCGADAVRMAAETGCDAVMIARGAEGNPWLFSQVQAALAGEPEPEKPTVDERVAMARRHAELLTHREGRNIVRMRKHAMWYMAGLPGAAAARGRINYCTTLDDFNQVFDDLLEIAHEHAIVASGKE